VRLDIDPSASLLRFTSNNALIAVNNPNNKLTSPASFNQSVPRAFTGTLYASSPSLAACPAAGDRPGWLASWPTFTVTSTAALNQPYSYNLPVEVQPALHLGKVRLCDRGTRAQQPHCVAASARTLRSPSNEPPPVTRRRLWLA
jgi:hypothetical protein